MFRFLKNIFNAIILVLAFVGLTTLHEQHAFDGIIENISTFFTEKMTTSEVEIGDFSNVNPEFNVGSTIKLFGYKTIIAQHSSSGQRIVIISSGKKPLLTEEDLESDGIKTKIEDLCKKFKYHSTTVENLEITDRGYITAYEQNIPYVKFNAKVSNLPKSNISGIVSVVSYDEHNQRLIISVNDNKHYSQLITSEFCKNIRESNKNRGMTCQN